MNKNNPNLRSEMDNPNAGLDRVTKQPGVTSYHVRSVKTRIIPHLDDLLERAPNRQKIMENILKAFDQVEDEVSTQWKHAVEDLSVNPGSNNE